MMPLRKQIDLTTEYTEEHGGRIFAFYSRNPVINYRVVISNKKTPCNSVNSVVKKTKPL
jgi:hypothetical protein